MIKLKKIMISILDVIIINKIFNAMFISFLIEEISVLPLILILSCTIFHYDALWAYELSNNRQICQRKIFMINWPLPNLSYYHILVILLTIIRLVGYSLAISTSIKYDHPIIYFFKGNCCCLYNLIYFIYINSSKPLTIFFAIIFLQNVTNPAGPLGGPEMPHWWSRRTQSTTGARKRPAKLATFLVLIYTNNSNRYILI